MPLISTFLNSMAKFLTYPEQIFSISLSPVIYRLYITIKIQLNSLFTRLTYISGLLPSEMIKQKEAKWPL